MWQIIKNLDLELERKPDPPISVDGTLPWISPFTEPLNLMIAICIPVCSGIIVYKCIHTDCHTLGITAIAVFYTNMLMLLSTGGTHGPCGHEAFSDVWDEQQSLLSAGRNICRAVIRITHSSPIPNGNAGAWPSGHGRDAVSSATGRDNHFQCCGKSPFQTEVSHAALISMWKALQIPSRKGNFYIFHSRKAAYFWFLARHHPRN